MSQPAVLLQPTSEAVSNDSINLPQPKGAGLPVSDALEVAPETTEDSQGQESARGGTLEQPSENQADPGTSEPRPAVVRLGKSVESDAVDNLDQAAGAMWSGETDSLTMSWPLTLPILPIHFQPKVRSELGPLVQRKWDRGLMEQVHRDSKDQATRTRFAREIIDRMLGQLRGEPISSGEFMFQWELTYIVPPMRRLPLQVNTYAYHEQQESRLGWDGFSDLDIQFLMASQVELDDLPGRRTPKIYP